MDGGNFDSALLLKNLLDFPLSTYIIICSEVKTARALINTLIST
jgi:hypothetical protein